MTYRLSPIKTSYFSTHFDFYIFIEEAVVMPTGSGAYPASCPVGTGGPFPGGKERPGRDADHSPPSSAEVVNE
jgi:hypothetical protein